MFPTIHRIRSYLGEQKTKILRRTGYLKRDWKSGLSDEAADKAGAEVMFAGAPLTVASFSTA